MEISRRSFLKIVGTTAAGTQVPLQLMAAEDIDDLSDVDWNDTYNPDEYISLARPESIEIEDDYPVKPGELIMRLDLDGEPSYHKLPYTVDSSEMVVRYNAINNFHMSASRDICLRSAHVMIGDFPYKWVDLRVGETRILADCTLTLEFDTGG